MATITLESQLHDQDAYPSAEDLGDRRCLLCGEPVKVPFVYWRFTTTAPVEWIVLHQVCADRFAWSLLRDCWELSIGRSEANSRYYVLGNLCGSPVKPFFR